MVNRRFGPRERPDYLPTVRPRAMREEGRRKLTPNYPDLGESILTYKQIQASEASFVSAANANGDTTVTIPRPTGVEENDLLLAFIAKGTDPANYTPPSGWTAIILDAGAQASCNLSAYYKVATANEPTSYAFTAPDAVNVYGSILAFRGVDTSSPVHVSGSASTPAGTTHDAPSVTTTIRDTMLICAFLVPAGISTWTPPSGMTEASDNYVGTAYKATAAAGATGAKTATSTVNNVGATISIALKPTTPGSRQTLLTPTTRRRLRVIRIQVTQASADARRRVELYYGTSATLSAAPTKVIDELWVPLASSAATRTWSRGDGPRGDKDEALSARIPDATPANHYAVIEYTEER